MYNLIDLINAFFSGFAFMALFSCIENKWHGWTVLAVIAIVTNVAAIMI